MGRAHEVRAASMAKTAAAKSKVYAKHGKLIYIAAKAGVPDPEMNLALKAAIEKAKKDNVPADNIKRAIEKAKGGSNESYDSVRYEGYGPNNSMFIIECLTDNVNRTYTNVRTIVTKTGCKLSAPGSVTYMFDYLSVFSFEGMTDEEVLEILLMEDCEVTDVVLEDGLVTVTAPSTEYNKVRTALLNANPEMNFLEDEIKWVPQSYVELTEEKDIEHYERLLAQLEDNDDVQDVYHNMVVNK